MPIVFAPPEPVAPGLSAEAGYAQEMAALGRYNHPGNQGAANFAALYGGGGRGRVMGGGADYDPGALAAQQQQAQLQAAMQMQQSTLTQAEMLHMNRLQNGMSYVDQQLHSGTIDQDTANALKTQIQTQINPLALKQQAMKNRLIQQQVEQANRDGQIMATNAKAYQDLLTNTPAGQLPQMYNPDTGRNEPISFNIKTHQMEFMTGRAGAGKGAAVTPSVGSPGFNTQTQEKEWLDAVKTIEPHLKEETKDGKIVPLQGDAYTSELKNRLRARGLGGDIDEERQKLWLKAHGLNDLMSDTAPDAIKARAAANNAIDAQDSPALAAIRNDWLKTKAQRRVEQPVQAPTNVNPANPFAKPGQQPVTQATPTAPVAPQQPGTYFLGGNSMAAQQARNFQAGLPLAAERFESGLKKIGENFPRGVRRILQFDPLSGRVEE